jgi:probable F420-dependent oxidoreductase
MRPFRFGISTSVADSGQEWREKARKAEDLGFDVFCVADHIRQTFQPLVALAVAAEATSRIRLGTMVINNDFRHPVLLAREAATLDVLSSGRLELGIGAGHSGDEYREAGIPFDPAKVRVARLSEAVQVMKQLWAGGATSFAGRTTPFRSTPRSQSRLKSRFPSPSEATGGRCSNSRAVRRRSWG